MKSVMLCCATVMLYCATVMLYGATVMLYGGAKRTFATRSVGRKLERHDIFPVGKSTDKSRLTALKTQVVIGGR